MKAQLKAAPIVDVWCHDGLTPAPEWVKRLVQSTLMVSYRGLYIIHVPAQPESHEPENYTVMGTRQFKGAYNEFQDQ